MQHQIEGMLRWPSPINNPPIVLDFSGCACVYILSIGLQVN